MRKPDDVWFQQEQLILANARRLADDAVLLVSHQRNSTAFAISLIALEEVGKIILRRWRTMDTPFHAKRRTLHLAKQCAAASLLIAARLRPTIHDPDRSQAALGRLVAASADAFLGSAESDWQLSVEQGLVDRNKQLALYQDEEGPAASSPRDFTGEDAMLLIANCRTALEAVDDFIVMAIARSIFEMWGQKKTKASV